MRVPRLSRLALLALCGFAAFLGPRPRVAEAIIAAPTFSRIEVPPVSLVAGQRLRAKAAATAEDGTAATVTWDFGDGSATTAGGSVQHTYRKPGLYALTLTATDSAGPTATQSCPLVVRPKPGTLRKSAAPSDRKPVPFQYVSFFGTFEPATPTFVEFRVGSVAVLVPATLVTDGFVRAAVPALPKGASLGGGTADVHVIQGEGAAARFTKCGTVKIANLPRVPLPPGEVTKSFIRVAKGVLADAQVRILGSALDTLEQAETIASVNAYLDAMTANVDLATGPAKSAGKAASVQSDFELTLSVSTVKAMDSCIAGMAAAGGRNTAEPVTSLAFKSWSDAFRFGPSGKFDAEQVAKMIAAEQKLRETQLATDAVTETVNIVLAPLTTLSATLAIAGIATANPLVVTAAAGVGLFAEVLTMGLFLGLAINAAHAYLTDDDAKLKAYVGASRDMVKDFILGKAFGAVAKKAAGAVKAEVLGTLRDLYGALDPSLRAFALLTDQPPVPGDVTLGVEDVTVTEGDDGTTDASFEVYLSNPSTKTINVTCVATEETAAEGGDYVRLPFTNLTFAAGQTKQTVAVHVKGDLKREKDETFRFRLFGASGAPIRRGQAVGTIADDDIGVLTADHGDGDALGPVTGCGDSTSLSVSGPIHFDVRDSLSGDGADGAVSATGFSPEFGTISYEWEGTLTRDGSTLTGTLPRTDNPGRPAATVTIIRNSAGKYVLTATVPMTYLIFSLDGTCTGPLHTFNHLTTNVVMTEE